MEGEHNTHIKSHKKSRELLTLGRKVKHAIHTIARVLVSLVPKPTKRPISKKLRLCLLALGS